MASQLITDFRRTLTDLLDLGRQGVDRLKDDLIIAERITPISQQALDFYAGIASGASEGKVDPAGGWHVPVLHPVKGHEVTHHELLQKFGLRDELAARLLTTAQDLLVSRDIQSPSRLAFAVRGAIQDIYFGDLIGPSSDFLHGGYLGRLRAELDQAEPDRGELKRLAYWIGTDLAREKDLEYAQAKLRLTQLAIAEIPDWDRQRKAVALIKDAIASQQLLQGQRSHINAVSFEAAVSQKAQVAVERMATHPDLYDPVHQRFRVMESRPRTDADAFTADLTEKMGSARDKLQRNGSLFYSRLSAEGRHKVAIKVDANMGADLTPTVTQGELVYAYLKDSFKRSDYWKRNVWHSIVESNGAENFYIGRENPQTLRDIGVFHYAMKAGLERVKEKNAEGSAEWNEADRLLAEIKRMQDAGMFYGSAAHRISLGRNRGEKMGDWLGRFERDVIAPAEKATSAWVRMTDPDNDRVEKGGGFSKKDFADGILELSTYGGGAIWTADDWEGTRANPTAARVLLSRGTTPHVLPGVTGPGKSMIGLVLTGTRPADTVVNRGGFSIVDLFPAIATQTGLASIIGRGGLTELVKSILDRGEDRPEVREDCDRFKAAWRNLEQQGAALTHFRNRVGEIHDHLRASPELTEAERFAYMRKEAKKALLEADDISPGFFDAYWEAARAGTRFAERAAAVVGGLIPDDTRGPGIGPQIGLMQMTLAQPDEVWTLQEVKVDMDPRKKGRSGPDAFPEDKIVEVPGGAALIGGTDPRVVGMKAGQILGYPPEANHSLNGSFAFDRRNNGISSLPVHANLIDELPAR